MSVQLGIGRDVASVDEASASEALEGLVRDRVASRIFAQDPTLWGDEAEEEASIRLGWTDVAPAAEELIPRIEALREELSLRGVNRLVLCGMGGSSLAPAVITRWAGVELTMIDSTHPDAVRRVLDPLLLPRTAVIVSSKSGGTIETRSHLAAFEHAFRSEGIDPAERVVIVTDPGSPLDDESREAGRIVFNADPNVGGRFSALTAFGLVPSGLAGVDVRALVDEAQSVRDELADDSPENPALRLAAAISAGLPRRFVLAVTEVAGAEWGLGAWIEQLIAESTGKDGLGVLPIALPSDVPEFAHAPANTVRVLVGPDLSGESASSDGGVPSDIAVSAPLGAQMLLWETATAALGRLMGIDPFNQPDVESAKVAARAALAALADGSSAANDDSAEASVAPSELAERVRESVPEGGYLSVQAYVDPYGEHVEALRELRRRLAVALGAPVALGYGPSFLHSVGQLHKGGPALGAFLQVLDPTAEDLAIPDSESTFGVLIAAQARGDRSVLEERGRPVVVVTLAGDDDTALEELGAAL
ncbi:MAG: glucose-6-phosphate isomerase [Leucobacter sp.]